MNEEREQGGAGNDSRWPIANRSQEPHKYRFECPGIGEDSKEEDGKDEHAYDAGDALNAGEHEVACLQSEACSEGGGSRKNNQSDQRRYFFAQDCGQERDYREQTQESQHIRGSISLIANVSAV